MTRSDFLIAILSALAIFVAQEVLPIYEKKYPNDDRPRKAIEAAIAYLKEPTDKNRDVADAAADAADAAADAADAARAAYAKKDLIKKIDAWFSKRIKTLKPWTE